MIYTEITEKKFSNNFCHTHTQHSNILIHKIVMPKRTLREMNQYLKRNKNPKINFSPIYKYLKTHT